MRMFEMVSPEFAKHKDIPTIMPKRATLKSAGYDFYLKENIQINPQQVVVTWTDIKVMMNDDEVLKIHIRSSLGIKQHLMIANGTGIIDADYYGNKTNDGNIAMALYNYGTNPIFLKKGDKVAQGIFEKYLTTDDDNVGITNERIGGIGSSGK